MNSFIRLADGSFCEITEGRIQTSFAPTEEQKQKFRDLAATYVALIREMGMGEYLIHERGGIGKVNAIKTEKMVGFSLQVLSDETHIADLEEMLTALVGSPADIRDVGPDLNAMIAKVKFQLGESDGGAQ